MKKRILSLLLCLALCLSVLPTAVFAGDDITELQATITPPPTGSGPNVKTVSTSGSDYTVTFWRWVMGDDITSASYVMKSDHADDIFRAGCTYYADIVFTPASGKTISDSAVATINGKTCFKVGNFTDGTHSVIYRYELIEPSAYPAIGTLAATVTAPAAGAKPDFTAASGDSTGYATTVQYWSAGGTVGRPGPDLSADDTFEAGKTYIVQIQFMPSVHKMFSEAPSVSINGSTSVSPCGIQRRTGALSYRFAFTVPAHEAPEHTITIDPNHGSGSMAPITTVDGMFTVPECTLIPPENCEFDGWLMPTGSGMVPAAVGATMTVGGDRYLVAQWKVKAAEETVPVFRLYNPYTQEHLLCSDIAERDFLMGLGWTLDGIAWHAPKSGTAVYRLYNPYDDWHTYSTSTSEIAAMTALGWTVDGVVSYSAGPEGRPIYRLFNPYVQINYHMFTAAQDERDFLAGLGWVFEGTAWYAAQN